MMHKLMTVLGAALLGALLTPTLSLAATATSTVNVRNAPVNGAVVDVLRPGQQVDVDRCQSNGWCYVTKAGPDGWVSSAFINDDDDSGYDDEDDRPSRPSRPDVDVDLGFSVPGFNFQIGNGGFDRPGRPGRPGGRDQVCFFERSNFRGDSFCSRPGENIARLGRWNDEISSIRVSGDAEVLVCQNDNFRGRCIVISRNAANLGPAEDEISSIRVR